MNVLSPRQIAFFRDHGFLELADFLEPEHVDYWRCGAAEHLGMDPREPESWRQDRLRRADSRFQVQPESRALRNLRQVRAAVGQLGGGRFRGGTEDLIVRFPQPDRSWQPPRKGHIDLIYLAYHWRFTLGATTYLYEVEPGGGAFCVWPGSHRTNWDYFREHPKDYFSGGNDEARHRMEERINARIDGLPVELTAREGTLLLWHSFLLHEASLNVSRRPRVGLFFRWGEPVEPSEPVETFGDLWESWGIAPRNEKSHPGGWLFQSVSEVT